MVMWTFANLVSRLSVNMRLPSAYALVFFLGHVDLDKLRNMNLD